MNDTQIGSGPSALVLVIDDSATFRAAVGQALRAAGYLVEDAPTGEEGLRAAARLRPDIIVVDRVLPDIDGTTVVRNIRLDPVIRRTPCLLVTADEDPLVEFTALDTGADAYVQKGADIAVLLARVAALRRDLPKGTEPAGTQGRRRILAVPARRGGDLTPAGALPPDEYEVVAEPEPQASGPAVNPADIDCVVIVGDALEPILETIDRVRAMGDEHVPLLVLAEGNDAADAMEALSRGADDYIARAAGPDLYAARLRAVLRRKEVEAEDRRVSQELMRRESEAAAARLRADLAERESQFKSRFLAFMAHELRTPLNAIVGFSQMLDRGVGGELSDTHRKHTAGIVRSAEHLLALVSDVLDLAKIGAGKLAIRKAPVALGRVVEDVRISIESLAAQREVRLEIDVPPDLPCVHGDAVRVQQVLVNLLSNALKFTSAGGSVTLTAAREDPMVRISVRDTGIGINPEHLGRLFQEFERLEDSRSGRVEGTGLGLALTKHLVELHGGRVDVRSEVGVGSEFFVWLPAAPPGGA